MGVSFNKYYHPNTVIQHVCTNITYIQDICDYFRNTIFG